MPADVLVAVGDIEEGWRLVFDPMDAITIHYVLRGLGNAATTPDGRVMAARQADRRRADGSVNETAVRPRLGLIDQPGIRSGPCRRRPGTLARNSSGSRSRRSSPRL